MLRTSGIFISALLAVLLVVACKPVQAPESAVAPTTIAPTTIAPTTIAPATAVPEPAPPYPVVTGKMEERSGEITSAALAGNLLGDPATRKFYVLLPPGYDSSDKRYPVVYVLPWGESYPYSNLPGFQTAIESLLPSGEAREMILVFADGSNKLGASLFRSSPTIGDYETYLVRELVDYVDANYRTLAASASRGLAGCSNGGDPTIRLAFKYPDVFSVAAPSGGLYDETMEKHPGLLRELERLQELPETPSDVYGYSNVFPQVAWYIQTAAGSAPNPDAPPLYLDMPFRIVDGKGEIVPEVAARIAEHDAMRAAERYVQQPLRLRGILIQHALRDQFNPTELVRGFERRLTELGVEHEYLELDASHCSHPWEATALKFMSERLAFAEPGSEVPAVAATPVAEPAPAALPVGKAELGITADRITSAALAGNLLGDPATRQFNVILPPGYATGETRYPVVYVLHAYEGDEGSQAWDVKRDMEKMLAEGAGREMILVFPDAYNVLQGSMYLSSPTVGDYETYLAQELVDYVDGKYRTLPQPESRGITGCWHGGDGALRLALRHPDVFSVVAPYSAIYDWSQDPILPAGAMSFRREPQSLAEFAPMEPSTRTWIAYAAGAAANPDKPPFYLDMPFVMVDGKGEVVPEVIAKIEAADPVHDLARYLRQPERLRAILLVHGIYDYYAPATLARAYSDLLTTQGIEHETVELKLGNCFEASDYTPVLKFMADNLVFEEPAQ